MSGDIFAEIRRRHEAELKQDRFKRDVQTCLDNIRTCSGASAFATYGPVRDFVDPGLYLNKLGQRLELPLSREDADFIKEHSRRAPFGRGAETIVDESVRRTWEIDAAEDVSFYNRPWRSWLNAKARAVARKLGVDDATAVTVRAEPYKLLLYGRGSMFKPHQDSEKERGMFGTLAVCLPSQHHGGEVVLIHGNRAVIWESWKGSAVDSSYGAWYGNVTHEVKPVTSGYRLVLTCNLVATRTEVIAAPSADVDVDLEARLAEWKARHCGRGLEGIKHLCWVFDHEYTDANICAAHLKGTDRAMVHRTARTCEGAGFNVYLATIEHTRWGSTADEACEHGFAQQYEDDGRGGRRPVGWKFTAKGQRYHTMKDVLRCRVHLRRVVELDGSRVGDNLEIGMQAVIQTEAFPEVPDEERGYVGYTGNAGREATHWYRRAAMLLVPKSAVSELLARSSAADDNARKRARARSSAASPGDGRGHERTGGPSKVSRLC